VNERGGARASGVVGGAAGAPADLPLDRLATFLAARGIPTSGLTARLISGGRSNLTYRLSAETAGGTQQWVLRRPPLGHVLATAHDMRREFRVISALQSTEVPVPDALVMCDDADVIGAPFFVMEYVEGEIIRTTRALVELGEQAQHAGHALVDVLAALHAIDPDEVGLADFGRPAGFMARQVRRWTAQLDASRSRDLPGLDGLAQVLADEVPQRTGSSLIHGDYRLDNCMLRGGTVVSVLDWEMATLGDPLADVALFAVYTGGYTGFDGGVIHSPAGVGSFPSTHQLVDRYVAATGRQLDDFGWYLGFAWFKLAVILEGIHYRNLLGKSAGDEFRGVAEAVPHAVERGRAALFDGELPA
jgi:aminoglycoside phosphotransferase (APT) family kinase protein